jgi:hypothetical protein
VIDLQTADGVALVGGVWRYADARIEEVDFVEVAADLGPSGRPNRTHDVLPHAEGADYDDSAWTVLARRRRGARWPAGGSASTGTGSPSSSPSGSATSTRPGRPWSSR